MLVKTTKIKKMVKNTKTAVLSLFSFSEMSNFFQKLDIIYKQYSSRRKQFEQLSYPNI